MTSTPDKGAEAGLLACPFCGNAMKPYGEPVAGWSHPTIQEMGGEYCIGESYGVYADDPDMIAAWNTRATPPEPARKAGAGSDLQPIREWFKARDLYDHMHVDDSDVGVPEIVEMLDMLATAPTVSPSGGQEGALRIACRGIANDYQTSDTHHPNHILIPKDRFEAIVAAMEGVE